MGLFDIFKSKKKIDLETHRQEFLQANGRITDGVIIDTETSENGDEIVFYIYSIQGVDFESSEILTEDKLENPLKYAPGAKVGIRFDPKNHGNSMLV
ncbi:MAG: hypothetical protein H0W58_16805 [Acidobacteria bacterium]|jgi:hypothetical protein|nr:hypothetical protein [Acidobacteriota bacterium]